MASLRQSYKVFVGLFFSVIIFGDSVSHLLEMDVLISLEGTLTQTRLGWVRSP